jgi:cyclopropane fatty-acyl-phospholipid synthase-like methyltransferase
LKDFWERDTLKELKDITIKDWSEERIKQNINFLEIKDVDKKILEIGAGIGRILKYLRDKMGKTVEGWDSSLSMVNESKIYMGDNSIHHCIGDGTLYLPEVYVPPSDFDMVFSIICFQHIKDINIIYKYCQSAYHLLHEGGKFHFQVLKDDKVIVGSEMNHYHNIDFLTKYLTNIGFKTTITIYNGYALIKSVK